MTCHVLQIVKILLMLMGPLAPVFPCVKTKQAVANLCQAHYVYQTNTDLLESSKSNSTIEETPMEISSVSKFILILK